MSKIDILFIIRDHVNTLKKAKTERVSFQDIALFYLSPLLAGFIFVWLGICIYDNVFELSVNIFSIFSALLLSVQVAMYGISRGEEKVIDDVVKEAERKEKRKETMELLREINTNISYLISISCISVTIFLLFYAFNFPKSMESVVSIFIYLHFFLTLLMILKRGHIVFDRHYKREMQSN